MSHVVTMSRSGAEIGGDQFSCDSNTWNLLIELGNTFGWKALGTSYVPSALAVMPDNPTRHDYLSADRLDSKLVDAADAYGWANALTEARSSAHLITLLSDRLAATALPEAAVDVSDAGAAFLVVMDQFITYAFGGKFEFWDSEAVNAEAPLVT